MWARGGWGRSRREGQTFGRVFLVSLYAYGRYLCGWYCLTLTRSRTPHTRKLTCPPFLPCAYSVAHRAKPMALLDKSETTGMYKVDSCNPLPHPLPPSPPRLSYVGSGIVKHHIAIVVDTLKSSCRDSPLMTVTVPPPPPPPLLPLLVPLHATLRDDASAAVAAGAAVRCRLAPQKGVAWKAAAPETHPAVSHTRAGVIGAFLSTS